MTGGALDRAEFQQIHADNGAATARFGGRYLAPAAGRGAQIEHPLAAFQDFEAFVQL